MVCLLKTSIASLAFVTVSADRRPLGGKMVLQATRPHDPVDSSFFDESPEKKSSSSSNGPFKQFIRKFFPSKVGQKCKEKRERGELPSAADGDSPIATFGYPNYNQESNTTVVNPGATLSQFGDYLVNIKIQATDYYASGKVDEIQAFLECFGLAKVEGADIDMDTGKWVPNTGNLCMQVENTDAWLKSMADGAESVMVSYTTKRILGALSAANLVDAKLLEIAGSISKQLKEVVGFVQTLLKYASIGNKVRQPVKKVAEEVVAICSDQTTTGKQKLEELKKLVAGTAIAAEKAKHWDNAGAISVGKKMILALTVHPRPANKTRATYCFGKATATLEEVSEAFNILVRESPLREIFNSATR